MSDHLDMWVIYKHPLDFPDKFVARLFEVTSSGPLGTGIKFVGDSKEEVERLIPAVAAGLLTWLPRMPGDDPQILGVWL